MGYSYSDEVLADSPYLYWKLDETSGTTATDSSPNGRDGTYANGATLNQTSLIPTEGTSVDLDGTNDHVYYTLPASVTGDFSLEVWFNNDNYSNYPGLFGAWTANSNGNYGSNLQLSSGGSFDINIARNNFNFWEINVGGFGSISTGSTYHVVLTVDDTNNEVKLYINGTQTGSTQTITNQVGLGASGKKLVLGSVGAITTGGWNGRVDNFAVYTSVLSATRITAHYNAATGPTIDDLTAPVITVDAKDATVDIENDAIINAVVTDIDVIAPDAAVNIEFNLSINASITDIDIDAKDATVAISISIDATTTDIEIDAIDALISAGGNIIVGHETTNISLDAKDSSVTVTSNVTVNTVVSNINIDGKDVDDLYTTLVKAKNPVHWWRITGTTAPSTFTDSGSSPVTATNFGYPSLGGLSTSVPGGFGTNVSTLVGTSQAISSSLAVNSTARYLKFPTTQPFLKGDNLTYEIWFRTTSTFGVLFGVDKANSIVFENEVENGQFIGWNSGYIAAGFMNKPGNISTSYIGWNTVTTSFIRDDAWHHLVLTKSTISGVSTYKSYVDGKETNVPISIDHLFSKPQSDERHSIGAIRANSYPNTNFQTNNAELIGYLFNSSALIDEIAMYSFAFSAADVQSHYGTGRGTVPITINAEVTDIDIELKDAARGATINVVKSNIGIRLGSHQVSDGQNVSIASNQNNIGVDAKDATLALAGTKIIYQTAGEIDITGQDTRVRTRTVNFKFVPSTDTALSAEDAEELTELDFLGLLYNQSKKLLFRIGNTDSDKRSFAISIATKNIDILNAISLSYDNITYSDTLIIENIDSNSVTECIYVKFDSNFIDLLGAGTFLINVENI